LRRVFDILVSLILIVLTIPLQFFIFLGLILDLQEFPIFFQERGITLNNGKFRIIKFKTLKKFLSTSEETNAFLKTQQQNHLTKFSKILRKTGLDEIPQLYNILFGEMSFIGPRPFMISDLKLLKEQSPYYYGLRKNIKSKPGLTGLWQLFGDRSEGIKNLVELDLLYEYNKSVKLDLYLFIQTFIVFLKEKNSDAIIPNQSAKKNLSTFIYSSTSFIINTVIKSQKNIIKKLETPPTSYSIQIPENYWVNSQTLSGEEKLNKTIKIIHINKSENQKTA